MIRQAQPQTTGGHTSFQAFPGGARIGDWESTPTFLLCWLAPISSPFQTQNWLKVGAPQSLCIGDVSTITAAVAYTTVTVVIIMWVHIAPDHGVRDSYFGFTLI